MMNIPAEHRPDFKHSIARELIAYIFLFSSLITLIGTGVQLYLDYREDLRTVEERMRQIQESYLESIIRSLWDTDYHLLRIQLEGILKLPDMQYAEIRQDGEIIISSGIRKFEKNIGRQVPLIYTRRGMSDNLGTLYITASLEGVYNRLTEKVVIILITQSVKTFMVSTFIFFLFYFLIGRHLHEIAAYTRYFDMKVSDKSLVLKRKPRKDSKKDELDQVVFSINEMHANLRGLYRFLEKKIEELNETIAERRRTERALLENEIKLRAIMDIPTCAITLLDQNGILIDGNATLAKRMGKELYEIIGTCIWDLLPPDVAEFRKAKAEEVFVTHRSIRFEDERNGIWNDNTLHPIPDKTGEVIHIAILASDITERKRAETEQQKLESQLRQAQKMEAVGQLAGGVAHDFNNLLQVIIGYGDMIADQLPPNEFLYNNMKEIMNAAQRSATLVRQLLLFSRRGDTQSRKIDLNELISNLMKMLRRVIGEHISLEVKPGFGIKPVSADPGQIEQILMNLCVNARDAMPDGGKIIIETENILIDAQYCRQHEWAKQGNYVVLIFSDTGCGIAHEIQERIFEPFFTTKEVGKGTGLGLATVYGIVRSHQGMIHLYSEPGHGATFKIYLPAAEQLPPASANGETESEKSVRYGNETVLFAEDEEMVRNMVVQFLKKAGYRVFPANDGEEAISLFDRHSGEIEIALLDVIMPKVSGHKVYEHIRNIRPDMPVIFSTGYSRGEFSQNGHYEIIQKPCSPDVFLKKIREVLDSRKTQA
jgi:PAS domain S-box-containing protein